jgi:hypothetical protein
MDFTQTPKVLALQARVMDFVGRPDFEQYLGRA